ncbi:hypothetical protein BHE90_011031 [Fusarium euwallaceae]|uniref:F-box domain-containing protein n=2 Tax=Fusarium solani species complex TaxID=232080 RepID=A0A3M2RMV2_9HYPO|nr:hypothetical protein CDV36_013866 [Fusarium kuroshium]RTE74522.1 hypothetical protein BHE90_011031 [Fusarium euwallaceae]
MHLVARMDRDFLHGGNFWSQKNPVFSIEIPFFWRRRPRLSLGDLPVEIFATICRNLCAHCQRQHVVDLPPDEIECALEAQQALSRLSRTCRRFRNVAQPILFHCYHSGRQPDLSTSPEWWGDTDARRREIETLETFLRTLLERPDLAKEVRALAFFALREVQAREVSSETQALFRQAGERAGFRALSSYDHVEPKWLQEAAIMAAPFLEQLLIYRSSSEGLQYLRDSPFYLPNLKYLVLPGQGKYPDECCHIQQMQDVLAKAQNLEVLAASDADCGTDIPLRERFRTEPWDTALSSLRRLSLHGLDPDNLAKILRRSPVLEDLEYFCDMDKYTVLQHDHLSPVRQSLRRLCYTSTTWEHTSGGADDMIEQISMFLRWDTSLRADFSFVDFPRLEILEVEQLLLYGPVFDDEERWQRFEGMKEIGPELFMASLPSSLRILHIGMVLAWPELHRDLLGMTEKLYRFQNLSIVAVDPYEAPPLEQVRELEDAFAAKGIVFRTGQTTQVPFGRGMLGVRPGHPEPLGGRDLRFPLDHRNPGHWDFLDW